MEPHLRVVQDAFTPDFLTRNPKLSSNLAQVWKLARRDTEIFISGESGCGKTLLARDIHHASRRSGHPFQVVDCASLPPGVIESELFGHVKGAFTSAHQARTGLLEAANGGTVFLDEISELPAELQSKLLRAVQHGVIRPVGSSEEKEVQVRWICATHANLSELVRERKFRLDLYYRLCKFEVSLTPLRERPEDILLHAERFFEQRSSRLHERCSPEAIERLRQYAWPGNVRQLETVLDVTDSLIDERVIEAADWQFGALVVPVSQSEPLGSALGENLSVFVGEKLDDIKRKAILATLKACDDNVAKAANVLGLSSGTLYGYLRKLRGQ